MRIEQYCDWLTEKYSGYFDVERNCPVLGQTLPVYAMSRIRSDKYFATRKISLGGYENLEHCLVMGCRDQVDAARLESCN